MSELNVGVLVLTLLVLLFSLTVHEAAHAFTANRLGDPTARLLGRLSLNPIVHIDPVGTVLLPLVALATGAPILGWAKPVPVDLGRLPRGRQDFVLIAAAGPATNLALALVASAALNVMLSSASPGSAASGVATPLVELAWIGVELNVLLAVFNLVPVPPLDGGNVLGGLLPAGLARQYDSLRPYGIFILYGLLLSGTLVTIIGPPYAFLTRHLLP